MGREDYPRGKAPADGHDLRQYGCLAGAAREIMFYRKEKIMGIASPTSGVRLVK